MEETKRQNKKSEVSDGGDGEKRENDHNRVKKGPSPGCSSGVTTRTQDVEEIQRVVDEETMIKVNSK